MKKLIIILILFCSIQGFGQIKGYWRLDGNSNDASGSGNNGTDSNITYSKDNGILNQGAGFNGSNSFIYAGDGPYLSTFSIIANVLTSNFNSYKAILNRGNNESRSMYMDIRVNTGKIWFGFTSSLNTYRGAESSISIELNKWVQIGGSYNGSVIKVYINGVEKGSFSFSGSPTNTPGLYIGKINTPPSGSAFFDNSMDELIISNTGLSNSYFKNEYSRTKGFF